MRRLSLVMSLAAMWVAGCYSPSVRDCTVACAAPTDCTGGQVCAGGFCTSPDHTCSGVAPDGAATDAPGDASLLCDLGCVGGTCAGGVCVIDCSATDSCPNDITCPPNIPCRVRCGDSSCDHKVICGLASACEVECVGQNACNDDIVCGKAPCKITCSGDTACSHAIKCKESCACDVTCTGEDACGGATECPLSDACRLGMGCSSALPGCDRCD